MISSNRFPRFLRFPLLAAFLLVVSHAANAETFLLMAEEEGCYWCGRWNKEIAPIYPNTDEGKLAPLQRFDLHSEKPEDIEFKIGINFTPTFILVSNRKELGRIEGYPGEDFFWGLLDMLIEQADLPANSDKEISK